jgi:hypothetical protein
MVVSMTPWLGLYECINWSPDTAVSTRTKYSIWKRKKNFVDRDYFDHFLSRDFLVGITLSQSQNILQTSILFYVKYYFYVGGVLLNLTFSSCGWTYNGCPCRIGTFIDRYPYLICIVENTSDCRSKTSWENILPRSDDKMARLSLTNSILISRFGTTLNPDAFYPMGDTCTLFFCFEYPAILNMNRTKYYTTPWLPPL